MKILLVGALSDYAIERFYLKYFNSNSAVKAEIFAAQNIFLKYYRKNIFNKIIFRLGYKKIYRKINIELKSKISSFNPSVILVFKGMEVFPETLLWAKENGFFLVNYNPDNPFIFTGRGSGNENVTNSIGLYHLHFTYNRDIQREIIQKFNIQTEYLPFAFDISEDLFQSCKNQVETNKVCFLGNPDRQRAKFINSLLTKGIPIDVYGHQWENFVKHPLCTTNTAVFGDEYWKTLSRYRVQLNIMRIHNEDSHNMRTFEIPGIGGIMLAPRTTEHLSFFKDQVEAFFYSSLDECCQLIHHLLSIKDSESKTIRHNARSASISKGYSYKQRSEVALNEILDSYSKFLKDS